METIGVWTGNGAVPAFGQTELLAVVPQLRSLAHVVQDPASGAIGVAHGGQFMPQGAQAPSGAPGWPVLATLPPIYPEWLGDRSFCEIHGLRFPYVSGAMANGIASTRLVISMARAGFLGFFGAAGLGPATVEEALHELERELGTPDSGGLAWGANLIHSPNEPAIEERVADLYIRRGVRRVSAAAYMALTPHIVRYAYTGLGVAPDGRITRRNYVFAKISRPEVARHFLEPAPAEMLDALVAAGKLTPEEGQLARQLPVAEDFTVESDSGGHTDNRPLTALLPTILSLRNEIASARGYRRPIRIGAAGGLGTPGAVAAAFALGASFVVTGSVNQACVESGLDADGKEMLAQADLADVVMAPAADMFELGVEVQVLKRGTFFAVRAKKLYELYRAHDSLDALPTAEKARLEKDILRMSVADAWRDTCKFWQERDPREVAKAEADPKHKMALVFRSYLGQSSRWSIAGVRDRRPDYQIWCGPAMGAFNAWTAGSFLAEPQNRGVVQVARNLLEGAAAVTRAQQLRSFGVPVPPAAFDFRPRPLG
ncbi:MAG: PfaD family polyunsaturated fatty acid/polyketide biosynthesis protein [Deltaproteobacteria bacterium]|nr:PfaD family polyunsaturated fatty acid/polyketide biosynthesis protein [Deltaproteobacteria bacterium]